MTRRRRWRPRPRPAAAKRSASRPAIAPSSTSPPTKLSTTRSRRLCRSAIEVEPAPPAAGSRRRAPSLPRRRGLLDSPARGGRDSRPGTGRARTRDRPGAAPPGSSANPPPLAGRDGDGPEPCLGVGGRPRSRSRSSAASRGGRSSSSAPARSASRRFQRRCRDRAARPSGRSRGGASNASTSAIASTNAPGFVLEVASAADVLQCGRRRLCRPRRPADLDPAIRELEGVYLYDIDRTPGERPRDAVTAPPRGRSARSRSSRLRRELPRVGTLLSCRRSRHCGARAEGDPRAKADALLERLDETQAGRSRWSHREQAPPSALTVRMKQGGCGTDGFYAETVRHLFGLGEGRALNVRPATGRPLPLQVPMASSGSQPRGVGRSPPVRLCSSALVVAVSSRGRARLLLFAGARHRARARADLRDATARRPFGEIGSRGVFVKESTGATGGSSSPFTSARTSPPPIPRGWSARCAVRRSEECGSAPPRCGGRRPCSRFDHVALAHRAAQRLDRERRIEREQLRLPPHRRRSDPHSRPQLGRAAKRVPRVVAAEKRTDRQPVRIGARSGPSRSEPRRRSAVRAAPPRAPSRTRRASRSRRTAACGRGRRRS